MKLKLICLSADGNDIIAVKFQERTIVLQGVVKWPENRGFEGEYPPRTDSEHGIKKTAFKPADFCFYTLHTHPS